MKSIIAGKRYNTETAERIAEWSNGLGYSDFGHLEETLYRTKNGAWFIHGGGGPMTKYAKPAGNMTSGSEQITPVKPDEARAWLEQRGFTDEVEKWFPDDIEDA